MLVLTANTDKISLITSSGADIAVVASYIERDSTSGAVGVADRQLSKPLTATTTTIVGGPATGTTRNIKSIFMKNLDASVSNDLTVQLDQNATLYEMYKCTLLAGETLEYIDGMGFIHLTNSQRLERTVYVTADSTHATAATFADITGLQVPMLSGVLYNFLCHLYHINNATTTGSQFGYNIGNAPSDSRISTIDTVTGSVTASAHSAGSVTARDTAITAQTTGATAIVPAIISGFIIPSADGTFSMRATSEVTVASGLIVKKGSWLRVWQPTT